MNSFTFLIYITGVSYKLASFLVVLTYALLFSLGAILPLAGNKSEGEPFWNEANKAVVKWQKRFLMVWFFLMALFIATPDRETALMMGASEAVSRGGQTEIGTELQKTILHQLKELQKDKK